jgi:hypothetical protein
MELCSMRAIYLILILFIVKPAAGQKVVDSIFFNLYTDSLKKGFFNYINVDGKMSDGSWLPLDTSQVTLTANTGYFLGNDLFIDSSYTGNSVRVRTTLKSNPKISKEIVIYIRKRGFDEVLKKEEELF